MYNDEALLLKQNHILFRTDYEIKHSLQKELITYVIENGDELPVEPGHTSWWLGSGLTNIKDKSLVQDVDKKNLGYWYFYSRLNSNIDWVWNDNPASNLVRQLLKPVQEYYAKITRVTLVIQKPGYEIPAHRDLVVGEVYPNMENENSTIWGQKKLLFKGQSWFKSLDSTNTKIHEQQLYLNLKIPLSLSDESPGTPFIQDATKRIYYSSENHLFYLNEALVEHGADKFDTYRGVVFVDGIFNLDKFRQMPKREIKIQRIVSRE